jgi:hypothetical protein
LKRCNPPPIQPNGPMTSPASQGSTGNVGRRPMIPQFDMDANEIMKVIFLSEISETKSRNLGIISD